MNILLSVVSIIFSIVVMFFGWCIVLNVDRIKYLNLRGFILILVGLFVRALNTRHNRKIIEEKY